MRITTRTIDNIKALDLREEALAAINSKQKALYYRDPAGDFEIVFFPFTGRAGVAYNSNAIWIDAESIDEALDALDDDPPYYPH